MDHLTDSPRLDLGMGDRVSHTGGGWLLDVPSRDSWAWADAFTPDECDSIIDIATRREFDKAETGGRGAQHKRISTVRFLMPTAETDWVFRRMTDTIKTVNRFFEFDLTAMNEGIQFTRYDSPGGKYDWHADYGPTFVSRKLSITVQLTDPDEYEGGELELNPTGDPLTMERVRGRAYAFPSWTLHRVKPMVTGTRYSLVAWVAGPAFR